MRETAPYADLEKALMGLMPSALSNLTQTEIFAQIDELAGNGKVVGDIISRRSKWLGSIAAALAVGFFAFSSDMQISAAPDDGMDLLTESVHMGDVRDEGLYVDADGLALRKISVCVVDESSLLDRKTGIEVKLTKPRKETLFVLVSTF